MKIQAFSLGEKTSFEVHIETTNSLKVNFKFGNEETRFLLNNNQLPNEVYGEQALEVIFYLLESSAYTMSPQDFVNLAKLAETEVNNSIGKPMVYHIYRPRFDKIIATQFENQKQLIQIHQELAAFIGMVDFAIEIPSFDHLGKIKHIESLENPNECDALLNLMRQNSEIYASLRNLHDKAATISNKAGENIATFEACVNLIDTSEDASYPLIIDRGMVIELSEVVTRLKQIFCLIFAHYMNEFEGVFVAKDQAVEAEKKIEELNAFEVGNWEDSLKEFSSEESDDKLKAERIKTLRAEAEDFWAKEKANLGKQEDSLEDSSSDSYNDSIIEESDDDDSDDNELELDEMAKRINMLRSEAGLAKRIHEQKQLIRIYDELVRFVASIRVSSIWVSLEIPSFEYLAAPSLDEITQKNSEIYAAIVNLYNSGATVNNYVRKNLFWSSAPEIERIVSDKPFQIVDSEMISDIDKRATNLQDAFHINVIALKDAGDWLHWLIQTFRETFLLTKEEATAEEKREINEMIEASLLGNEEEYLAFEFMTKSSKHPIIDVLKTENLSNKVKLEVIRCLLTKHHCNPNEMGPLSKSALEFFLDQPESEAQGNLAIAKLLIQHGASLKASQKDGLSPLHYLAKSQLAEAPEIMEFMIENGADVNYKAKENFAIPADCCLITLHESTPLVLAAIHTNNELVRILEIEAKETTLSTTVSKMELNGIFWTDKQKTMSYSIEKLIDVAVKNGNENLPELSF